MPESARVIAPGTFASRWATVARGLFSPDRAFAGPGADLIPKASLCVLLFTMAVAGARLTSGLELTPQARVLAMAEFDVQFGSLFAGAPSDVQARARSRMGDAMLGSSSSFAMAASIAFQGLAFVVTALELWLLGLVVTQFFGGQEERSGPGSRASLGLTLVAFVPLALRRLAAGIIAAVRSPDAALNALTLRDYRAAAAVRFDLMSLTGLRDLPPIVAAFLSMLSDPFVLWTLAILVLGGREVFRLPLKAAAGQVLVLVAVVGLQTWLLGKAGIAWEL